MLIKNSSVYLLPLFITWLKDAVEYEKRRTDMLQLLYYIQDELNEIKEHGDNDENLKNVDGSDNNHVS